MRLSWEQIRHRATEFVEEWKDETYEKGEAQSFYNDFFGIFGIKRRQVASYERRVQSDDRLRGGLIDLFWPGTLIAEHKSSGLNLDNATGQALDYFDWLPENVKPRFILTCDFQRWRLLDLEENREIRFLLRDLPKHIEDFAFILGRRRSYGTQAAVTIDAAELMGKLHDRLKASGYTGHDLERLLVRLLFCLFADDTGIFEPKDVFLDFLDNDTKEDGSDTGSKLNELFDVLDTPENRRQANLPDELRVFPYVNGDLFAGAVRTPRFDAAMREALLDAARFDWSGVSPAIFGSLFQSVMNAAERRSKGAHYTTEENILKLLGPLVLDDLRAELDAAKARKTGRAAALNAFCQKLPSLRFLDPACGCGNFLVIAYRELRKLELEALEALYPKEFTGTGEEARQGFTDVGLLSRVSVDQFHGIELEEFPARIAEVAMWMTDHLANNALSLAFGTSYARIPLRQSARILHADALEVDWNSLIPAARCHYVLGNPPFLGAKKQTGAQRGQVRAIARLPGTGGTLDYVAAWFVKAADYLAGNPRLGIAFVATNSLTQGEQVAQLWPLLFRRNLEISFAHRTFEWSSEARDKAHVHCVILGLAHRDAAPRQKRLFSYPSIRGTPIETRHDWLSPYLVPVREAQRHLVVKEEARPINGAPKVVIGSKPIDGGYLILSAAERADLLAREPAAAPFVRPFIGAEEYLNGGMRWILALQSAPPKALASLPMVRERIEKVAAYRRGEIPAKGKADESKKEPGISSSALAKTPTLWHINVLPDAPFIILPRVSSERRDYAPIGWLYPPAVPSDSAFSFIGATLYDFAILTSAMHMAWLRQIGGRLKSDYRYSIGLVYNTFPWPDPPSPAARTKVEALAQAVLDARAAPKNAAATLAQLYDPLTMPADLRAAHTALDRAIDRLYRPAPFTSDADRVEHLLTRYEALVNSLSTAPAKNRQTARRQKNPAGGKAAVSGKSYKSRRNLP